MTYQSELIFDARKLYFFSALIALLYGLSPVMSAWFFDSKTPFLLAYEIYFVICTAVLLFVTYPTNHRFKSKIEINEARLMLGMVLTAVSFVVTQIAFYGDFTTAFVVGYMERAGVEASGGIRLIFYPITTAFFSMVLLFTTHLYARRDRINIGSLSILIVSVFIFSALGSRNLLLWSFSAVLALFISKLRYRHILSLVFAMYLLAVLFAFIRNQGLIAHLAGDQVASELSWDYFDPMVHEFGSSYRTFSILYQENNALDNAPYGLLTSFFVNQLPSFMKPSNFISFTDYISLMYAAPGEGIGSSPMTEAHLSGMLSLISLIVVLAVVYWPAYYLRRWPAFRLFTYALAVAVSFNFWRIGSAEVLKMFGSSVVVLLVLAKSCGFRVSRFRSSH